MKYTVKKNEGEGSRRDSNVVMTVSIYPECRSKEGIIEAVRPILDDMGIDPDLLKIRFHRQALGGYPGIDAPGFNLCLPEKRKGWHPHRYVTLESKGES